MKVRPYSFSVNDALAASAGGANLFTIDNSNRSCKLLSVLINTNFSRTVAPFDVIPDSQNNFINWTVQLNGFPNTLMITQPFTNFAGTGTFQNQGRVLTFKTQGQYFFDSVFLANNLQIGVNLNNRDVLNAWNCFVAIVLEIGDLEFMS